MGFCSRNLCLCLIGLLANGCGGLSQAQKNKTATDTSTTPNVLSIVSFSPPSSSQSGSPTVVQIQFSENNVDPIQGNMPNNYAMVCSGGSAIASSAVLGSGLVSLSFPSLSAAAGSICSLFVSPGILDANGNYLKGNRQADYFITTTH